MEPDMNTPDRYSRNTTETLSETTDSTADPNHLAGRSDPSARRGVPTQDHTRAGRSIAWIRPSELITTASGAMVARTAAAQAETARRARKVPARITRSAIARATPSSYPVQDRGLSL